MPVRCRVVRYWRIHQNNPTSRMSKKPHSQASDSQSTCQVTTRVSVSWWPCRYVYKSCTFCGVSPLGIDGGVIRLGTVPLLLVLGPLRRVVVLLLDEQGDASLAVELVEVAGLPGDEEADESEPREDEERVHHPVGHHPL